MIINNVLHNIKANTLPPFILLNILLLLILWIYLSISFKYTVNILDLI